jgi:hypothetical protein
MSFSSLWQRGKALATEMESNRSGILDIVRSMAIRTARHIVIAILRESLAMNL